MKLRNIISGVISFMALAASITTTAAEPIKTPVPARPAGATDLVGFAAPALDTVRVGFIGLGMRGPDAVDRFAHIPGTKIVALCDIEKDRAEKCQKYLDKAGMERAAIYGGAEDSWKALCDRDDINLVYIATDWVHHAPMAKYAMEKGKHVAIEVPAATSREEIWDLIDTS